MKRVHAGCSGMGREILNNPWILFSHCSALSFQSFDICGRLGGVRKALKLLCTSQVSWLLMVLTEVTGTRSRKQISVPLKVSLQRGTTAVLVSLKQNYGVRATGQQCTEAGDICAICQAEFREPLILMCQVSSAGWGHWRPKVGDFRVLPHVEVPSACTVGALRWVFGAVWSSMESIKPNFKSQFCLLLAGCPWAGYLTSLTLGLISKMRTMKNSVWSSHCGSAVMNPPRICEDVGSIPGLTQWVKCPTLL